SKLPWGTALGFSLAPLAGGFFMLVLKDPEWARRAGLITAKAQLTAGSADWATFLSLLAQALAVGGLIVFGIIISWVFGREYADGTVFDLLALPTTRSSIVVAKLIVVGLWSGALIVLVDILGLAIAGLVGLPAVPSSVLLDGLAVSLVSGGLTILLMTPFAYVASAGHGYLPPMAGAFLALALSQIAAVAGWGEYFPWAIPALLAGAGQSIQLGLASYAIVVFTFVAGAAATLLWWQKADQVV
ncbi:MAG: ABC transporter permease, partial [Anaerolineales bacterium]